jgi:hypothetical protein
LAVAERPRKAILRLAQDPAGIPYNIPLGGMLEFTGTTVPNGSFVRAVRPSDLVPQRRRGRRAQG